MLDREDVCDLVACALLVAPVLVCGAAPALAANTGTVAAPGHPTKAQIEHDERATLPLHRDTGSRSEPARSEPIRPARSDGAAAWQLALSGVAGAAVTGLVVAARRHGPGGRDVTVTP